MMPAKMAEVNRTLNKNEPKKITSIALPVDQLDEGLRWSKNLDRETRSMGSLCKLLISEPVTWSNSVATLIGGSELVSRSCSFGLI